MPKRLVLPPKIGTLTIMDWVTRLCRVTQKDALSWFEMGAVKVDGEVAHNPEAIPRGGASLTVHDEIKLPTSGLEVVHLEEDFVVVNKPAGLPVQGTSQAHRNALEQQLKERFGEIHTVHRLDLPVSGLVAFARSPAAARIAAEGFDKKQLRKTYVALGEGTLRPEITLHLEDWTDVSVPLLWVSHKQESVPSPEGKSALSRVRLLKQMDSRWLVAVHLVTGRTHQIRAHMKWLGIPIVGDQKYGGARGSGSSRIALHAWKLQWSERGWDFRVDPGDDFGFEGLSKF